MRISSKFKDYYDFISHKFGEDPDIVYLRGPLRSGAGVQVVQFESPWDERGYFTDSITRPYPPIGKSKGVEGVSHDYHLEWIVAGPHVVTFLAHDVEGLLTTYERIVLKDERYAHLFVHNYHKSKPTDWSRKHVPWPTIPAGEKLNALIRAVGAPVFRLWRIGRYGKLMIADRVPVLKDFGFPAYIAPEQLWQDLYAVMTNVLRHNPDKAPPVVVGEKFRIEAAGFDLKSSFRHPVNPKKKIR